MRIKYIASLITTVRIIGAFTLFLTTPLSGLFFIIYCICCVSDILDGYIARKTNTTSRFGEVLDSIADLILIAVMLVILIPLLALEQWMFYWIVVIASVRVISMVIGFVKYRAFASLHTYANKATGIVLACFPILLHVFGLVATVYVLCGIASLSALEELIITARSRMLNRNVNSLFFKKGD